jgi:hypothetical protein
MAINCVINVGLTRNEIITANQKRRWKCTHHHHDKPKPLITAHIASAQKTRTKIATIDDYYFQNRTSAKSNIEVTGRTKKFWQAE